MGGDLKFNDDDFAEPGDDQIQWSAILATGNTAKDGTAGTSLLFTADASRGSYIRAIVAKPIGTNIQTVLRIFVNNGQDPTVAANNFYFKDYTLPATTLSETAGQPESEFAINTGLPPGYRLYAVLGTTVAAGWTVGALAGKR